MKKKNEQNACNALIEILERMTGVKYECESSPDDGPNDGPEVDFILTSTYDGIRRIAVEHTVIELFPEQRGNAVWSHDIVETINARCLGKIPSDRYYILTVPPILIRSFNSNKKRMAFVDSLAPWVTQHACQLKVDGLSSCTYESHQIRLTCSGTHPMGNGNVWSIPELPADLKTLQRDSFNKSIQHALRKLRRYKCKDKCKGFATVMLLEDIAGVKYGLLRKELPLFTKVQIYTFIDYIVVLDSFNDRMINGNVWKENWRWYTSIPYERRYSDLRSLP